MTEEEARRWIDDRFGQAGAERVAGFLDAVVVENAEQNLVSPASISAIWVRHALDSAQLLTLAPEHWRTWVDVGTGGGFPGFIVALLAPDRTVIMVEPRRKRAAFLERCIVEFGLRSAEVAASKVEAVQVRADVISARAVGSIENLLRSAMHCATDHTTWLLPRGQSGADELADLPRGRSEMFHVEHSITDHKSRIIVLKGVPL